MITAKSPLTAKYAKNPLRSLRKRHQKKNTAPFAKPFAPSAVKKWEKPRIRFGFIYRSCMRTFTVFE